MDTAPDGINTIIKGNCQRIQYRIQSDDDKTNHKQGIAYHKYFVCQG